MRKFLWYSVFLLAFTSVNLVAQKKRVAIVDFDFGTVQRWWGGNWDIGKGIADMVVNELVNDGTLSVIERKKMDLVLAEQNFSNSNRADASSAAKVGTQKGIASVKLTARIIDINTGEILASRTGEGKSQRKGLMLGGGGAGGGGFGAGGISMTSSDFRETIIGEATEAAVKDLSAKLIADHKKLPDVEYVIRGMVADVEGSSLILNIGSGAGLKAGDTLKILRVKRTVKDPATGKVLREITTSLGEARIDEVDEGSSMATVVSGSGVKVGDLVRN